MTQPSYEAGQTNTRGQTICGAKKRDGNPCASPIRASAKRCKRHGGATPQAKRKATERAIQTKAREILGTIDPTAPPEHPVETLMRLIQTKAAEVQWLRTIVKNMTEQQLTWGITQHRHGVGAEGPIDETTEKTEQNIWWKLLRTAEDQLADWTTKAAKAGVEERVIRLAEGQAHIITNALQRVFTELKLTQEQKDLIPQIVPPILRTLETQETR